MEAESVLQRPGRPICLGLARIGQSYTAVKPIALALVHYRPFKGRQRAADCVSLFTGLRAKGKGLTEDASASTASNLLITNVLHKCETADTSSVTSLTQQDRAEQ